MKLASDTIFTNIKVTTLDTISYNYPETIELFNEVRSFYQDSFSSLLTLFTVLVAIVGVIVPIVMAYLQAKSNSRELDLIREEVDKEIKLQKSDINSISNEMMASISS
jgi:hypothetical protein